MKSAILLCSLLLAFHVSPQTPTRLVVDGFVVNADTRKPLVGVNVTIDGDQGSGPTTTDSNGHFALDLAPNVKAGDTIYISLALQGYTPWHEGFAVPSKGLSHTFLLTSANKNFSANKAPATSPSGRANRTELAMEFAGREVLMVQLANTTTVPAERPKYWFGMEDVTNCFTWASKPDDCQPLPLPTQSYHDDYINGERRIGPWEVLSFSPESKQHVKTGDVLVGVIGVTCFNCSDYRMYFVYFKVGDGGWIYRVPDPNRAHILKPLKTVPDQILEQWLQQEAPEKDRIPIPVQFDYTRPPRSLP